MCLVITGQCIYIQEGCINIQVGYIMCFVIKREGPNIYIYKGFINCLIIIAQCLFI